MEQLIEALQIFLKYGNPNYPTHCERDILYIVGIDPNIVSEEDKSRLKELGFTTGSEEASETDYEQFYSFKYGSA